MHEPKSKPGFSLRNELNSPWDIDLGFRSINHGFSFDLFAKTVIIVDCHLQEEILNLKKSHALYFLRKTGGSFCTKCKINTHV